MRPRLRSALSVLASFAIVVVLTEDATARRKKQDSAIDSVLERAREALIPAPQDLESCFSPVEPCDVKLSKFLRSAARSIDVAIYDLTLERVAHDLLAASLKMPVRIVVDRKQSREENSLVPLLIQAGANVRFGHQRGIMHDKFTIVDGRMLETGSFNYTRHASAKNNENQLYLSNPAVVDRYRKRFEQMWQEAGPASQNAKPAG